MREPFKIAVSGNLESRFSKVKSSNLVGPTFLLNCCKSQNIPVDLPGDKSTPSAGFVCQSRVSSKAEIHRAPLNELSEFMDE
jgi:hypothetical protein